MPIEVDQLKPLKQDVFFLPSDSVRQPEMLLNPGSRLARNGRLAQSTGELDMNSAYPARGPQRDFNTLPPYHEPPSFEEAMRQSSRKPKTRKSTGDLTGPGQGRHSGRRPRQARPVDEPTDSSDGEQRFTPQRTAPPPPRVRLVCMKLQDLVSSLSIKVMYSLYIGLSNCFKWNISEL